MNGTTSQYYYDNILMPLAAPSYSTAYLTSTGVYITVYLIPPSATLQLTVLYLLRGNLDYQNLFGYLQNATSCRSAKSWITEVNHTNPRSFCLEMHRLCTCLSTIAHSSPTERQWHLSPGTVPYRSEHANFYFDPRFSHIWSWATDGRG